MSRSSKKHRDFVSEPLGNKSVTEVGGIGKAIGTRMKKEGIGNASQLVGQYLTRSKNDAEFRRYMHSFGANKGQADAALASVKEYVDNHM